MSVVTFLYLYLCLKWWGHQMKTKHQTHQTHSTKLNLEISCVISSTKLNYPGGKRCSHIDIKSFWLVVCFSSVQKAKVYGWNSMYPREGAMETLADLYECLQKLKSKPSQSERLHECIVGKKSDWDKNSALVLDSGLPLRNSTLVLIWRKGRI